MGYPFGNDPAKIEGYKRFWAREPMERPLIGFSLKSWFPMYEFAACRPWVEHEHLTPYMVHPADFIEDQERLLREGEEIDDDILRGACPSQAIQWLSPMLGAMESTAIAMSTGTTARSPACMVWPAACEMICSASVRPMRILLPVLQMSIPAGCCPHRSNAVACYQPEI